jgi:photosystem II stability/assembly factor-like uncharacterized protein
MKKLFFIFILLLFGLKGNPLNAQSGWIQQISGTTENLFAVFCIDTIVATVVGDNGTILRTTNGGDLWIQQISGIQDYLGGVSFIDANQGIAVGYNGRILRTTNGGINWGNVASGTTNRLDEVIYINQTTAVAVGWNGTILRSSDGGLTWFSQNSNTSQGLVGVHFTDINTGTAVGWNGTILRTTNGGNTWVSQINPLSGTLLDLWGIFFTTSNKGIATGENGTILRTTNGGNNWSLISSNKGNRLWSDSFGKTLSGIIFQDNIYDNYGLYSVFFGDTLTGMITGYTTSNGLLLKTIDGGITWVTQSNDTTPSLLGIGMKGPKNAFAVGQGGKILHTTTGGNPIGIEPISSEIPNGYFLSQNYPNPFNPKTIINFRLPTNNYVTLTIYDILGHKVSTLVNEELKAGTYQVDWDASNYTSGVYFYKLTAGDYTDTKRVVLIK